MKLQDRDDLLKGDKQGNERVQSAGARQKEAAKADGAHDDLGLSDAERDAERDGLEKSFNAPPASKAAKGGDQGGRFGRLGEVASKVGKKALQHRKKVIAGGIAGSIIATIIGIILALLPLKIEAMIKNIIGDRGERVEATMEHRMGILIAQYAANQFGDGNSKLVITGGPLKTLFDTWKAGSFEKDLKEKHGISFENGPGSEVRIHFPDGTVKTATTRGELKRLFSARGAERDSPHARQLRLAVKDVTKWSLVKNRRNVRQLMAIRYGVSRWKHTSKKGTAEEFDNNLKAATMDEYKKRSRTLLNRILSGSDSGDMAKISDGIVEGAADIDTPAGVSKDLLDKIMAKAGVPLFGWIDLGVRLDQAGRGDTIGDFVREKNAVQYVHTFAFWASVGDGLKTGDISGEQVNAAMKKLDGMERSAAFNKTFMKKGGGETIRAEDRVDWDRTSAASSAYTFLSKWSGLTAFSDGWYKYVSPVIDKLGGIVSGITGAILSLVPFYDWVAANFGEFIGSMINWMLKPVVTDKMVGAPVMNAVYAGADITYNEFAKEHGASKITVVQAEERSREIAAETRAARAEQPLIARLFDTDNEDSPLIRLAMAAPSNPQQAVENSSRFIARALTNPTDAFRTIASLGSARAVADQHPDNISGQDQYDWTAAQRGADFTEENVRDDPAQCGDAPDPAQCKLDSMVIQTGKSLSTTDDDGGLSHLAGAPVGGGVTGPITPGVVNYPPNLGSPNALGYYRMPPAPNGEYVVESCAPRQWGSRELVGVLYTVGIQINQKYPDVKLRIGDLNASGHKSHKWGVAVDITTVGRIALNMDTPNYSREKTIAIGQMLLDTKLVKNIWYNDPAVNSALINYARANNLPFDQIKPVVNHRDHYHLDISVPRGPEHTPSC